MKHCYLEVTHRKGRPLAAYYYLPRRDDDKSAKTRRVAAGLLADFAADGRPIGIERRRKGGGARKVLWVTWFPRHRDRAVTGAA
ncbi:MAG: DUF2283 domain-containing protein [Planctomycetes bacterium]|nr:DUF2283 domain-containing protein [Planctomycetota bacterium]